MPKETRARSIPVYTSRGDWVALMRFPHLYSSMGEWIGWITSDRQVYDVDGLYVGWLTDEPRILRKRTYDATPPARKPPPPPERVRPPATVPLPPMMAELPFDLVDVLQEQPDRLHTSDTGDLKQDME
jgi:hypothetical protein